MKFLLGVLLVCVAALAKQPELDIVPQEETTAFNYHEKIGIPEAARIRQNEEQIAVNSERIAGGSAASLGMAPWKCGLVIAMLNGGTSVCGATLLSNTRAVTAAHCWNDGRNQARQFIVVLGSIFLFSGGTRITTTNVQMHESWDPFTTVNDVAMVSIPWVTYNSNIRNIALASGHQTYVGQWASAAGFGSTGDSTNIGIDQFLRNVWLQVIANFECQQTFGNVIRANNICTSGNGGVGTCVGDSGGPLAIGSVLIGINSFGSMRGCQAGLPSVFSRVTSFNSWISARM